MQRLPERVTDGLGAGESASARPERTAGREPGGNRKTSAAEAGRLEGLSACWVLQNRAGPTSQAVAEGAGGRAEGRSAGTRRAAATAAAGPSTRVSQCEAAGGGRASVREGRGSARAAGAPALPASRPRRLPPARAHRLPAAAAPARAGAAREPACPLSPALCLPLKMGATSS